MLTVVLKAVKMLLSCCPKNSQDAAVLTALKAVQDAEKKPLPQRPSIKTYSHHALHRRPGVVKNEQGYSHLTRRMRRVRKQAEPTRLRVGT
jgi:hypothetical protein